MKLPDKQQWYTNKELFEKFDSLKDDLKDLRGDLKETRAIIKKYNDLRRMQEQHTQQIQQLQRDLSTKASIEYGYRDAWESIRKWTPWLITVFSILFGLLQSGAI